MPVVAAMLLSVIGTAAAITVLVLRPTATNNLEVIVLIFAFVSPPILALLGHAAIAAAAKGKEEGRIEAEQRAEQLAEKRPHGPRRTDVLAVDRRPPGRLTDDLPGAVGGRRTGDGR